MYNNYYRASSSSAAGLGAAFAALGVFVVILAIIGIAAAVLMLIGQY